MAYRSFHLSKTPYAGGPAPAYKRWNGSSEVNWDDTSAMSRYALTDLSPTAGWESKQVAQDSGWSPFYQYAVGLWQWISGPLQVGDIAGKLVYISAAASMRVRVKMANKTQNYLQVHKYVRIIKSDGTTRVWLARGQVGGSYNTSALQAEDSGMSSIYPTQYVRVYDNDRICLELGVLNGNLSYIDAGRTIDVEIGAGSGTPLALNDLAQNEPYAQLVKWTNVGIGVPPVSTSGKTRASYSKPIAPSHRPERISQAPTPATPQLAGNFFNE